MNKDAHFTVAQIASALGRNKRTTAARLARSPADSVATVRGQVAPAWSFIALPESLRAELLARVRSQGFRDVAALLASSAAAWQPSQPLAQRPAAAVTKARTLCAALAGTLRRLNDTTISEADFRARGLAEYRAAFGHAISEKQWRRLLDRTLARDGGAEDWQRVEIYLDEAPALHTAVVKSATLSGFAEHRPLRDLIASFGKPGVLSATETELLWIHTFEQCADMLAAGWTLKKARRSLLDFLHVHAPALAKNRHALHVTFNRKQARWKAGDGKPAAIRDGRAQSNAQRRAVLSDDDRKTLLAFAAQYGGGLSEGWREALSRGVLSDELTMRYIENPAAKSYVPHAIRGALGNDAKLLADWMRGPRQAKLGGAFIERNPNTFCAGDWMQGDDCTLPNLYYEATAEGERLMRGQFLAMIDVRTTYILGFVLISAPPDRPSTYNAWHIRNLITTVHDTYGMPRQGFYFENGTWRAKLLTGKSADWSQTETGLRHFGLRFVHARLPRAKVIERVFGALQNLMQAEPGYVGRSHLTDRYERTYRRKSLVESGRLAAGEHFLSRDEWVERLTQLVMQYNEAPRGGKYCGGLSPRAAYEKHFGAEPLVRLPDEARYLLANEVKRLKIGRNGISFLAGRADLPFTYKNERTGELCGRMVEVFFNKESPAILGVRHPDSGEVFAVRRATFVPGMDAEPETLAQAFAENDAHNAYSRALYRAIQPGFSAHFMARPIFRPTLLDGATVEAGRQLQASAAAETEEATRETRINRRTATAASRAGLPMPTRGRPTEERARATEEVARLLEKARAQKAAATASPTP